MNNDVSKRKIEWWIDYVKIKIFNKKKERKKWENIEVQ